MIAGPVFARHTRLSQTPPPPYCRALLTDSPSPIPEDGTVRRLTLRAERACPPRDGFGEDCAGAGVINRLDRNVQQAQIRTAPYLLTDPPAWSPR